jgi:hypothetical protein
MKAIVFLALVAFSQAAHLFYYAGTTNSTDGGTSPTANYAIVDTNGVCTASTTASGYQMFTINSTANPGPTFYWITAIFQAVTVNVAQVQVYNGRYTPATPCGNLTFVAATSSRAPHSSVLVYLTPGFHDVVVTTTNPAAAGVFSVHADRAMWNATTSDSSPYMYIQNSGSSCSSSSSIGSYTSYTWTAATTGMIDIVMFSYNSSITTNRFTASLYNTSSANLAGLGTGNASNPVDLCATGAENFFQQTVYYETQVNKISQTGYASATFTGVPQVAGQNYTVVFTSYISFENYIYGIWTRPSLLGTLGTTQNYDRPVFGSIADGPCVNGSSQYYWFPVVFTAQYNTYVVDNGYSPTNNFDTAACLYSGNNVGAPDQSVAPAGCTANWLQCVDTGDIGPLHQLGTTPGRNYTIVQTSFSSSGGSPPANYMLWIYTGVQLGPLPITTTGVETGLLSSSASMIVASLALTFAAFFF